MAEQKRNFIEVVGTLSEVDLKEGTKDGKNYLAGTIKVKVTEHIGGNETPIEVPFNVFSYDTTNAGKENPAYASLKAVKNDMVSLASATEGHPATRVRVCQATGAIQENAYYNKQGTVSSGIRFGSSFFNQATVGAEDKARFETVICIKSLKDEVDKEGIPTGRLIVEGVTLDYKGQANIIKFIAGREDAIAHIKAFWSEGDTVQVNGVINYSFFTETFEEEVGFGDPIIRTRTTSKRELLIMSGSANPMDEMEAYAAADISAGMSARQAAIEATKKSAPTTAKPATSEYGF